MLVLMQQMESVMQMGGNDGTCVFKSCLEMFMVYDPGMSFLQIGVVKFSFCLVIYFCG